MTVPQDLTSLVATARQQSRRASAGSAGRAAVTVYGGRDRSLRQTVATPAAATA